MFFLKHELLHNPFVILFFAPKSGFLKRKGSGQGSSKFENCGVGYFIYNPFRVLNRQKTDRRIFYIHNFKFLKIEFQIGRKKI